MDKQSQSRLGAILDNAVDAIITIDERGIIESVNPATQTLFGYSEPELVGQNVKLLMPSPYRDEHDGYLQHYLETGQEKIIGIGREVCGLRKDGHVFPMHLAVSQFLDEGRRLFTGIVRDITDLKVAQQRLTQLNEELEARVQARTKELREAQAELVSKEKLATLGQVSAGIAHEIRNPLNAVKTSVYYLLNAEHPSPAKQAEHLDRIDRQVTLIDNVVTALSDVARLPPPDLRAQSIGRHLREMVNSTSLPSTIEIAWELPADLPHVKFDENQLSIAFRNLLRNAREAMKAGGILSIGGHSSDGKVHVFVGDTGVGISPEHLERIMEPLFTTKTRGMGLGLAITRAIVQKNGGEIQVVSELGKGTRFTVTFDAAASSTSPSE